MAALKLLLSQARRHSLLPNRACQLYSLTSHHRSFSSESNSNPPRREPIPIQPVSYPVKPKSQPSESQPEPESQSQSQSLGQQPPPPPDALQRPWTREDIRYVKDAPSVAAVAYPARVAPLPDDKVATADEEVESERRKIEAENELRIRMAKAAEEERMKVPFPLLIKPKKNVKPAPLDLAEAIRQVKANAKAKFDETVEAHIRLGVDSKRTEMAVRGTVILPHGAPKAVTVAVFAQGAEAEDAKAAGADIVGGKELIEEIASNELISISK